MTLRINDTAPDFEAETTAGPHPVPRLARQLLVRAVLASQGLHAGLHDRARLHGAASSPSSTGAAEDHRPVSVDPVDDHVRWAKDIEETQGTAPNYPMIGDPDLTCAKLYGMLPAERRRQRKGAPPADNPTVRNVFVIGPDKKIKLMLVYPMTTGRNFDEVLRVIDSLQLTAKHKVATPANWKQGEDVIIAGSVSDEEAKKKYPGRLEGAEALPADRAAARLSAGGAAASGDRCRGRWRRRRRRDLGLEDERDLLRVVDVDGHLAAVLQLAEQQLVGERARGSCPG